MVLVFIRLSIHCAGALDGEDRRAGKVRGRVAALRGTRPNTLVEIAGPLPRGVETPR